MNEVQRKIGAEFYEAKERLGLLTTGDPGAGDKIQVTDTFIVSAARKVDKKIKSYPKLKEFLSSARRGARKLKIIGQQARHKVRLSAARRRKKGSLEHKTISLEDIVLKTSENPVVSIIIPAFNKFEYTVACLHSIATRVPQTIPFEVIVVDNASNDKTSSLSALKGLKYIRNKENLGFVGGCNVGASHAAGEYIVFLNNDTEVTPTWLSKLYETITKDKSIGLVGSKIVYPNGLLQEAGGIVFNDASGLNYGKFDQADAYQYNYVRDVDYCSGASIIISKKLFDKFGGFDKLYQPAYYEDTDLAFKVRKEGLRVVYQPESVVYHIEGGTAGTNINSGFKKYQSINQKKFIKRWRDVLQRDHVTPNDYYLGRDRFGNKLALVIEESVPKPDKDSGSVRMVAIIRSLQSLGYKVTFWPNDLTRQSPYTENLQQLGVEVAYGNVDFMQFSKHFAHYYDVVIMSRPEICAKYINVCRSLYVNAQLIYDTVDLHYVRLLRQADFEPQNAERLKELSKWYEILEKGLMERVDITLVVSSREIELLKEQGVNSPLAIVSNIHQINEQAYKNGFSDRKDIVFVGNYAHLPNGDAVRWFVRDIFPLIRKKNKDIRLHVVGSNMQENLASELKNVKGAVTHGFMSDKDLRALLKNSRIFVSPLRYGAGVKGKIGQSIEFGLPVVTTSIGAEGMYLENNKSCLIGDYAEEFAKAVITLYSDEKLWQTVRSNAKKYWKTISLTKWLGRT
jgi:Predicted glycosyltransferases